MAEEPENLTLVFLRRLDAKMDGLVADVRDLKGRMTMVETQIGQMMNNEQSHSAAIMSRLDRMEGHLDRIERQADIITA